MNAKEKNLIKSEVHDIFVTTNKELHFTDKIVILGEKIFSTLLIEESSTYKVGAKQDGTFIPALYEAIEQLVQFEAINKIEAAKLSRLITYSVNEANVRAAHQSKLF